MNAQKKSGFLYAKKCTNPSLVRLEFIITIYYFYYKLNEFDFIRLWKY